ncbi:DUF4442 domain-containing protein [Thiopseudomonas alkaliphila]|uniref:DUF4442 domain-containing protein n=1 Tax=Thiopseudomonas alkaliphila TaxID=1697053 RepID=UPI002576B2EE|nr:DUF4442 domain-containing protein [Thiopseudomonas alkaliphila]MDM1707458.1 DUF4442 domain-containing protein [Thiopseudomonas alkaliphila]
MSDAIQTKQARALAKKARWLKWGISLYPPYLGAGISVKSISADFRQVQVQMKLRWYNRNYVGTQFGGSLYSMTDPFYMLMLMQCLGPRYLVWDQASQIDFISPGKGCVQAQFQLSDEQLVDIQRQTAQGEKYLPVFQVNIFDSQQRLIARVQKTVYVRLKPEYRPATQ